MFVRVRRCLRSQAKRASARGGITGTLVNASVEGRSEDGSCLMCCACPLFCFFRSCLFFSRLIWFLPHFRFFSSAPQKRRALPTLGATEKPLQAFTRTGPRASLAFVTHRINSIFFFSSLFPCVVFARPPERTRSTSTTTRARSLCSCARTRPPCRSGLWRDLSRPSPSWPPGACSAATLRTRPTTPSSIRCARASCFGGGLLMRGVGRAGGGEDAARRPAFAHLAHSLTRPEPIRVR